MGNYRDLAKPVLHSHLSPPPKGEGKWETGGREFPSASAMGNGKGKTDAVGRGSWLQLAALNLIDDAARGVAVDAGQLETAHRLMADLGTLRTDTAEMVLQAAKRVLLERDSGAKVDAMRVTWAEAVLAANPVAAAQQAIQGQA